MQRKQWQREKVSYPRVANSVESSVIDEKLSFQSPTQPGSANVRTGEGVGYELNYVSQFEAFHKIQCSSISSQKIALTIFFIEKSI